MIAIKPRPIDYAIEPPGSTLQRADTPTGWRLTEPAPGAWHYLRVAIIAAGLLVSLFALGFVLIAVRYGMTMPTPDALFRVIGVAARGMALPAVVVAGICWLLGRVHVTIDVTPTELQIIRGLGLGSSRNIPRANVASVRRRFYRVMLLNPKGRLLVSITFNRLANARSAAEHLRRALTTG